MLFIKAQSIYLTTLFFSMYRMSPWIHELEHGVTSCTMLVKKVWTAAILRKNERGAVINNQLTSAPSAEQIIPESYRAKNAPQSSRAHSQLCLFSRRIYRKRYGWKRFQILIVLKQMSEDVISVVSGHKATCLVILPQATLFVDQQLRHFVEINLLFSIKISIIM